MTMRQRLLKGVSIVALTCVLGSSPSHALRYPASIMRATPVIPTTGSAKGVWTIAEVCQARAQSTWPAVADAAATITFAGSTVSTSDLTTYTFSAHAIGTAASGRRVIVGAFGNAGASRTVSSVTVGGNAATQVVTAEGSGGGGFGVLAIYIIQVDSGTTADIVVTFSGAVVRASIGVWAAYDLTSSTATDTGSSVDNSSTSDTLNVSAGGVAVAIGACLGDTGTRTYTWAGLTERYDETVEPDTTHTGSSTAFAAAQTGMTVSITPSGATVWRTLVMAAFR